MAQNKTQKEKVEFYTGAVKRGVEALDKEFGRLKWLKLIDLKYLDLESPNTCICGQIFGSFWSSQFKKFKGVKISLDKLDLKDEGNEAWVIQHGFYARDEKGKKGKTCQKDYDLLTSLWYIKVATLKIEAGLLP